MTRLMVQAKIFELFRLLLELESILKDFLGAAGALAITFALWFLVDIAFGR